MLQYWVKYKNRQGHKKYNDFTDMWLDNFVISNGRNVEEVLEVNLENYEKKDLTRVFLGVII